MKTRYIPVITFLIGLTLTATPLFSQNDKTSMIKCGNMFSDSPSPSSYQFSKNEDHYYLTVDQNFGDIPIYSALLNEVTIKKLPERAARKEIFEKMGGKYQLIFEKNECIIEEKGHLKDWRCHKRSGGVINSMKYEALSFFVFTQKITSSFGTYQLFHLGFDLRIKGKSYLFSNEYYNSKECQGCVFK